MPRRAALLALAAVIAAATLPPWPVSVAVAQRPEVTENSLGMRLVKIPAGQFEMGGETIAALRAAGVFFPEGSQYAWDAWIAAERPVHRVRITKPFLLGQTEVTLGQFLRFYNDGYKGRLDCEKDGAGGWGYDARARQFGQKPQYRPWSWGHPDMDMKTEAGKRLAFRHPVVNVSWNDCVAFCEWLSRKEGKKYRLPSEAEWEYACRAGTTTRYWTGDDPESLAASENISDGSYKAKVFPESDQRYMIRGHDGHAFTAPVGSLRANPLGLADMQGNVAEWCADWYDTEYYAKSPAADPKGPVAGSFRVARGGSWNHFPAFCRSAHRHYNAPWTRNFFVGFRVVCELEPAGSLDEQVAELLIERRYDDAEPLALQAMAEAVARFGPDEARTAPSLNNLAALYRAQGKYDLADSLYKQSLAIAEKSFGPNHHSTGTSLNNLALLYITQGKYDPAEPLLERALAILEKDLGPNHPRTESTRDTLAALRERMAKAVTKP